MKRNYSSVSSSTSLTHASFECQFKLHNLVSNAIVRVDMMTYSLYRYNFQNEGVISAYRNVLAYILCISVVDHMAVTHDELVVNSGVTNSPYLRSAHLK